MNKLHFGTDGIRGKVGHFPFIPDVLQRLGTAIAQWCGKNKQILIGYDTRFSGEEIKTHLAQGLAPLTVIDGGILPTPAVLSIMQQKDIPIGIVISASHNPYTDNGIKIFSLAAGGKITQQDEDDIVTYFATSKPKPHATGNVVAKDIKDLYCDNMIASFPPQFLEGKKIALDCAHGATYLVAPKIFKSLGADVITCATTPNGKNINANCGALHPEALQKKVSMEKADAGFAFDGDGDRVIAVNKDGQVKDGDDMLAILLQHPDFTHEHTIVGTAMTNHGLALLLEKKDKTLLRTKVGDKYVAEAMQKNDLLLGGETSGHIIISSHLNTGDGIFVALKTLESMFLNNNEEMRSFHKLPQIIINVPISKKKDLTQEPFCSIIKKYQQKLVDGRIVVRYSGTENLLRVMVEDLTESSTESIAHALSNELQKSLSS